MPVLSPAALLVTELRTAILSVAGPWLDLSDPAKLIVSDMPLASYDDIDPDKLPMVLVYSPADSTTAAATNRHEVTTPVTISIIDRPENIDRSVDLPNVRTVGRQIVRSLFDRQRAGSAQVSMHLQGDVATDAECPLKTIVCAIKFTVTHLEAE